LALFGVFFVGEGLKDTLAPTAPSF